jgi:hypothetical protein
MSVRLAAVAAAFTFAAPAAHTQARRIPAPTALLGFTRLGYFDAPPMTYLFQGCSELRRNLRRPDIGLCDDAQEGPDALRAGDGPLSGCGRECRGF